MIRSLRAASLFLFVLAFPFAARAAEPATRPATAPAAPRFEKEIAAFEALDRKAPPPRNAILFVGSSTFRMWGKRLGEDFAPHVTINRGFGGSTTADLLRYTDRIVIPYRPRGIVVYAGDNDIAQKVPPEKIVENFKTFVQKVQAAVPGVHIWYLSIKPSGKRWAMWEQMKAANQGIRDYAATTTTVHYIDIAATMLGPDGLPRRDLYEDDLLHVNRRAYQLWVPIIKAALEDLK